MFLFGSPFSDPLLRVGGRWPLTLLSRMRSTGSNSAPDAAQESSDSLFALLEVLQKWGLEVSEKKCLKRKCRGVQVMLWSDPPPFSDAPLADSELRAHASPLSNARVCTCIYSGSQSHSIAPSYVYEYVCIYIYRERERGRER